MAMKMSATTTVTSALACMLMIKVSVSTAVYYQLVYSRDDLPEATHKVSVVIVDGVTVGHPCCSVCNCHILLLNNHH
jgi:hypothetical protein